MANYKLHLSHVWAMRNFCDPSSVTFYLCVYLILNKGHLLFTLGTVNMKHCLAPKAENVRPHSIETATPGIQPGRENATPSSGTSPLAFYKEVLHV